jgi:peptide/nickel transport system substrate-binding protein
VNDYLATDRLATGQLGLTRRGMLARLGLGGAALVAGPGLISACSSSSSSTAGGAGSASVVWTNVALPQNLDPAVGFDSDSLQFVRNVYEGLLEYAPGSTELRPALATSYTTAPDGLSYTFTLRDNVYFHDGTKLDSAAVVQSLTRLQELNTGPATYLINVKGFSAPDAKTVVITMSAPYVFFPGAVPWFPIVSPQAVSQHKTTADPWAKTWFASNAAGTGPYMLSKYQANSRIDMVKFDKYWQPFKAGVPAAGSMTLNASVTTQLELLQGGQIDFTGAVSPSDAATAKTMSNVALVVQPGVEVKTLPLNMLRAPLDNPKVRAALVKAFDYASFKTFFKGFGDSATSPLPPSFPGWDKSLPTPSYDLAGAKQLLAEAGHSGGGFTLDYIGVQGLSYESYAGTILQSALQKLGITLNVQTPPWPQIPPMMNNPATAPHITFLNQSANTDDPSIILRSAYGSAQVANKGGYNWSYFTDSSVDSGLSTFISTSDAAKRNTILAQLQQTIVAADATILAIAPQVTQPVAKKWSHVRYDALYNTNVVRWFYTA